MIRRPPRSTLFPYTTLFRSAPAERILFRRKNVGFLFQQYNLLPAFTAAENVAVPLLIAGISRKEALDRAGSLLSRLGLSHRIHALPSKLSGGQQQRVALARSEEHTSELQSLAYLVCRL